LQVEVLSATQPPASPCLAQGSVDASAAGPTVVGGVPVTVLLTPTFPAPQAQSQGAHVAPGAHAGHAQVQVVMLGLALVTPPQAPAAPQVQLHGAHVSPGVHTGHAQVQVPLPPLLLISGAGGFEQSHWTAGQSASGGQAIGCTQVQPPPEASRVWQYPPASQAWPAGQRSIACDAARNPAQAQRVSASHSARSASAAHGSGVAQTPSGHVAPAGQSDCTARHAHPAADAHAVWVAFAPQASFTTVTGTARFVDCS
jgi:hypothetical protein